MSRSGAGAALRPGFAGGLAVRTAIGWVALFGIGLGCRSDVDRPTSSDGLVLVRKLGDSHELFRARLSDGRATAMTNTPDSDERWPYWSDAANRLVYQQVDPSPPRSSDLILWQPDGSSTPLHATPRRDERWPAWAPDGRGVAYAFRGARPVAGVSIHWLGSEEEQVLALTPRDRFFFRPSFSPDGRMLVAQRRGEGGTGSSLWILAPGAEPRPLVEDPDWFDMKPFFTRGGDRVVFSRRRAGGGNRDVCAVAVSGGPVGCFASDPGADDHSARPSPTRDEAAFVSNRGGTFALYRVGLDGSDLRMLVAWPDRDAFAPRWSPDGERVVVTVQPVATPDPSQIEDAHIVVLDRGGNVLLDMPGAMPDWMPPWR